MAADVSGWRQSWGRRGKAGASAWAIGSIPCAYAGNICPPKQDITVQKKRFNTLWTTSRHIWEARNSKIFDQRDSTSDISLRVVTDIDTVPFKPIYKHGSCGS
jgi:hypothetical protein